MILQIHDELVFEVPEAETEAVGALVRSGMEGVVDLRVPVIVNMTSGPNWSKVG
ncbi:MAG: DNA polymerase [Thermodesulfobacteriota bacterium]